MNPNDERLFLIGGRGAGKTTVGRLLAAQLGWKFLDADEELQRREGRSIAAIFDAEGEPYFRKRESVILADLVTERHCVVATGGGVVLAAPNRELLRQSGRVVWLRVSPAVAAARVANDAATADTRPTLSDLTDREPLYRETCHFAVDTDDRSPDEVFSAIFAEWESWATSR